MREQLKERVQSLVFSQPHLSPHPGPPVHIPGGHQNRLECHDLAPTWAGLPAVFPTTLLHTNCISVTEIGQISWKFFALCSSERTTHWPWIIHLLVTSLLISPTSSFPPSPTYGISFVPFLQHSSCTVWYVWTLVLSSPHSWKERMCLDIHSSLCRAPASHFNQCWLHEWIKCSSLCSEYHDALFDDMLKVKLKGLWSLFMKRRLIQWE